MPDQPSKSGGAEYADKTARMRCVTGLKWCGTAGLLAVFVAFVFSTGRGVLWHCDGLCHEVGLCEGVVMFGWRPPEWCRETDQYLPEPGWSLLHSSPTIYCWWVERSGLPSWEWIAVPLWIPFAVTFLPTAYLWRRQWPRSRPVLNRWIDRLRPRERKRLTLPLWILCCLLHVAALYLGDGLAYAVYRFYDGWLSYEPVFPFVTGVLVILFWTTPLWAILWAWLCVRLRNRLFERQTGPHCLECGYNLTGNVSGVCPECGTAIPARTSASSSPLSPRRSGGK